MFCELLVNTLNSNETLMLVFCNAQDAAFVGNIEICIKHESLILAQNERWRQA